MDLTLFLLGMLRLMLPAVLLPATTALGSIHPRGRELGVLAGANVIMPNLSPPDVRSKYLLYDNKLSSGAEAAEGLADLRRRLAEVNCRIATGRGDHHGYTPPVAAAAKP
jgi:biotin synthase